MCIRDRRRPGGPKLVCLSIALQAHQPTRHFFSLPFASSGGALHIAGRADRKSQGPRCGVVLTTSAGALPNLVQHGQLHAEGMGQAAPLLLRQRSPIICTRPHNTRDHRPRPHYLASNFVHRSGAFWLAAIIPARRGLRHDRQLFERSNASAAFGATPCPRPTRCLVAHEAV